MILKPEILTHPNIPKPLHGLNPRTIMGKTWWDQARRDVYESTAYHCIACGVHRSQAKGKQWMECHEYWDIHYEIAVCEVVALVPLCHYCHNFIHSGRMLHMAGTEFPVSKALAILDHGFKILLENDLPAFFGTVDAARELGMITPENLKVWHPPEIDHEWCDWVLWFNGKEYRSQFNDYEDWQRHYSK